jgi:hypothetical protein
MEDTEMKNKLKKAIFVLGLPAMLAMNVANATESYTGYVRYVQAGVNGTDNVWQAALFSLSSTPTGAINAYRFTADTTYALMLTDAKLHGKQVQILTNQADGVPGITAVSMY